MIGRSMDRDWLIPLTTGVLLVAVISIVGEALEVDPGIKGAAGMVVVAIVVLIRTTIHDYDPKSP